MKLIALIVPAALALFAAGGVHLPAAAQAPAAPPSAAGPVDAAVLEREMKLANELRCLVCQNQSIAESNAELAVDLRRQIRELIAQGRSDAEIRDYMTARYGDFVLYRPPLRGTTALLWFGPGLLLVIGAVIALRFVRRRTTAGQMPAGLTPDEHARAARLLGAADAKSPAPDKVGAAPSTQNADRGQQA